MSASTPSLSGETMNAKIIGAVALALGLFGTAHAGGFAVDVQSARATGMGTAVTSQIDDASAIYYNAAGILQGKGLDLVVGDTLLIPSLQFTDSANTNTSTKAAVFPPPHVYATYGISDEVAVGVGLYSPYGLGTTWPTTWEGQQISTSSQLSTYYINPTVAVRPFERLKIGVGLDFVRGVIDSQKNIDFLGSTGTIEVGGGAWGTGANVGAQVEILPKQLSFGVHYRGEVKLDFNGMAHFTNQPVELQDVVHDQAVTSTLRLPQTVALGLSYAPIPNLRLAFDTNYADWHSLDNVIVQFNDQASQSLNQNTPKNWKGTWNYHIGGEYAVNEQLRVRLGVVFDPSPSPQETLGPDLPTADLITVAAGAGYRFGKFRVDLGYEFVTLSKATSTLAQLPGTYQGNIQVLSLSLGYHL
jgi:long-chain fatty acid transport protein